VGLSCLIGSAREAKDRQTTARIAMMVFLILSGAIAQAL